VPVTIRSGGARHGVPGLPDDVVFWPHRPVRSSATRFISVDLESPDGLGGWQGLYRKPPVAQPGRILLQVRVGRNRAVDVAATLAALGGLTSVRTRLPALFADGVEHLLPSASYPAVTVSRQAVCVAGRWRRVRTTGGPHWTGGRRRDAPVVACGRRRPAPGQRMPEPAMSARTSRSP
jgi:hypothetical protein